MSSIPRRRAVVLTRSAGGLLAGAWLAKRGIDTRVLCVPGTGALEFGLQHLAPEVAEWCAPFLGAMVRPGDGIEERWHTPEGWRAPREVTLGNEPSAQAALDATALDSAARAQAKAHLTASAGVPSALIPTAAVREAHGTHRALWVPNSPIHAQMERLAEHVRDAGGDVLHDVEIEELDVADKRVMGVWSDHGLEHVEEVLWTDLDAADLWVLKAPIALTPTRRTVELAVDLDVEQVDVLPALAWLGRAGVPVARMERSALLPGSRAEWTQVRVWLTCAHGDARAAGLSDLTAWLQAVLPPLIGTFRVVAVRGRRNRSWSEQVDAAPALSGWLSSHLVPLPGALPGSRCGLAATAQWLMRLEGRPPSASTGKAWL